MGNTLDKSETIYKPTARQLLWLKCALKPEVNPTITAIAEEVVKELSHKKTVPTVESVRKKWYLWMKNPLFVNWWSEAWRDGMSKTEYFFDKIGMKKAASDYRYWEAMQMKHHKFARQEEKTIYEQDADKKRAAVQSLIQGLTDEEDSD